MSKDQQVRRADLIFRIVILLLAGLWLAFPQVGTIGAQPPTAVSELSQ